MHPGYQFTHTCVDPSRGDTLYASFMHCLLSCTPALCCLQALRKSCWSLCLITSAISPGLGGSGWGAGGAWALAAAQTPAATAAGASSSGNSHPAALCDAMGLLTCMLLRLAAGWHRHPQQFSLPECCTHTTFMCTLWHVHCKVQPPRLQLVEEAPGGGWQRFYAGLQTHHN